VTVTRRKAKQGHDFASFYLNVGYPKSDTISSAELLPFGNRPSLLLLLLLLRLWLEEIKTP